MVRNLLGLKARLFWNGLRSDRQRQIGLPLIGALIVWIGWSAAHRHLDWLNLVGDAARPEYLAWTALVLFVAWIALPVVIFPLDEGLDPQQLAVHPIPRPRLAAGLTTASLISVPILALAAVLFATVAFRPASILIAIPAALLYTALLLVGAQAFTTIISAVLHSRRGRDLAVFLVMGIGLASFAGYQLLRSRVAEVGMEAAVLGTPIDSLWWAIPPVGVAHAISSAWSGAWLESIVALMVAAAWIGTIGVAWERTLRWMLVTPKQEAASRSHRRRTGFRRGVWTVPLIMARKELRFYWRDPRQRLVWTGTVIFVGLAIAGIVVGSAGMARFRNSEWLPMLAPILVLMVGLPIALNQFGWERNAASYLFALPAKPRSVILGKNLAAVTGLLAEAIFLGALLAWFSSSWRWFGLVPAIAFGAIACLLAVGNVVSVLAPLRLPREGTDMFAQATEQGLLALVSQVISFFSIGLLLVVPAAVTVLTVSFGQPIPGWFAAVFSILWGLILYSISLGLSGWLLKKRVPEVVGWVQVS